MTTSLDTRDFQYIQDITRLPLIPGSKSSKNNKYRELAQRTRKLIRLVETSWQQIPAEKQESLRTLAFMLLDERASSTASDCSWENRLRRVRAQWICFIAYITGQLRWIIEAAIAANELAHAVMDVIDEEEAEMTVKFLDCLMQEIEGSEDKLVLYTKEMDSDLEDLLSGVEVD